MWLALVLQASPINRSNAVLAALIALSLLFLSSLSAISQYNGLLRARMRTRDAWSCMQAHLKRHAGLIPHVIAGVRAYATREPEVFDEITEAREALAQASGPRDAANAHQLLIEVLGRLLTLADGYPQLRSLRSFRQLQEDLADTEEKIAYARQVYNTNVLDYNRRIRRFPGNQFARWFRFESASFFDADAGVSREEQVSFAKG